MSKKVSRERAKYLAKLVTDENRKPCAFCQREVDDEVTYGKLYAIGDIQCHYFCVLLSCCLVQKGKDEEGLFGFLYPDILAELERSKKHRCSYCNKDGATLGCSISQCRKQFHLPCGRERDSVSLFYGNYKSFCRNHAPKQKVTENVMAKARVRMRASKKPSKAVAPEPPETAGDELQAEAVCVICCSEVECFPSPRTFWPPCCARDAWLHRDCVQRMSLSAGMHYLKCPLCNDKENFYQAVIGQGFYVPDRDASWELEQNAFAEIYERELLCAVAACACPAGRSHDDDHGPWDIKLCLLCGCAGGHARCLGAEAPGAERYVCDTCRPAAPVDLESLAASIDNVILSEQARPAPAARRPVMPSRMSLRRTKQRQAYYKASNSQSSSSGIKESNMEDQSITLQSRQDLNLKTPKRKSPEKPDVLRGIENKLFSPVKMIEQGLREKVGKLGGGLNVVPLEPGVVESVRRRFRKPKPLSEKKKIVDDILEDLVNNILKEKTKTKEPVRAWCSPKKSYDGKQKEDQQSHQNIIVNVNKEHKTEDIVKTPDKNNVDVKSETQDRNWDIHTKDNNSPNKNSVNNLTQVKKENRFLYEDTSPVTEVFYGFEGNKRNNENTQDVILNDDDSSNSTFQLPPEFVADSDNSMPIFDTPKKKTVEIQKDLMEISENDTVVNIDLVKMDQDIETKAETEKCAFKFSPNDKESLGSRMDFDLESFKNQYLNEVDRYKCSFKKHKNSDKKVVRSIDYAVDAKKTDRKNKKAKKKAKKRRMSDLVLQYNKEDEREDRKRRKKSIETEVSIQNDSMRVKISLKKKKFKLKIVQAKEQSPKCLKQYVLKYTDGSSKDIIAKPDKDVTPMKRKYVKQEKSPDNLVQTSIQNFFKGKSSKN